MADSSDPSSIEVAERGAKSKDHQEEQESEGFMAKVKDFIHDIGEKIEETIGFGKPTASVSGFHLPSINLEKADVVVDVLIRNPNPVPIPLVDIEYLIESDGRKLVSGTIPDAGTIHAHGSETVKIPLTLIYKDIEDTYDDIKPGAVIPYRAKVALLIDVPVFGRITIPLEKTGEIPIPYKPDVDVDSVEWDRLSLEETAATMKIKVENKNKFDLGVRELEFELTLADTPISRAKLGQSADIAGDGVGFLEVPISFRPKDFGSALWGIIRGRGAGYSLVGKLEVETPFGPMHLPISKEGGKTTLKKKEGCKDEDEDEDEGDDGEKKSHHSWGIFSSSREAEVEADREAKVEADRSLEN
ncbi:hypothetical protein SELMODRAFT_437238 [Selaginella moellendorffii]|uniref:Water stress and hypersensitive response domain-containing protein n=1 Tax=Selaginella moellendorffii TaxID=88036 RepID=D8QPJ9_SELML|nr:uncharacterized protein LOC9633278 [Selaginella moellendorffii]EFJ38293.1 hypothetical protein SELMODRAFT_437238 [Selaginella moellendorffii]|eukprot:XP_002960754.1 uncharacterized protein LOC9633278 [Selaginella moellendorffii]